MTYADAPRLYGHVARAYAPDHLAIRPDQCEACSVADRCGVNACEWAGPGYAAIARDLAALVGGTGPRSDNGDNVEALLLPTMPPQYTKV